MGGLPSSATPAIQVRELSRNYFVHEREAGFLSTVKSLFHRKYKAVQAVNNISFTVQPGEMVGFLGPNGAGKTTTIKMLSGLLYPNSGEVTVLGHTPSKRENAFLRQITVAMGRRNQLIWDVPAIESFEVFRAIYDIAPKDYKERLDELIDLMELEPLLYKPVRNLSLGERMRCELSASLLHQPKLLLLDEPTIGLDLLAQSRFRDFIAAYNQRNGATVLITSHYVGDVEELCRRVIFIDKAHLIYDGLLQELADQCLPYKMIQLLLEDPTRDVARYGRVMERSNGRVTLQVSKAELVNVTRAMMNDESVRDVAISDPPMTDVIKHVYTHGVTEETEVATSGRKWRPR